MSGKSQRVIACLFPDWPATALLLDTERDLSTPVVIVDNCHHYVQREALLGNENEHPAGAYPPECRTAVRARLPLSLIHISEPTRRS